MPRIQSLVQIAPLAQRRDAHPTPVTSDITRHLTSIQNTKQTFFSEKVRLELQAVEQLSSHLDANKIKQGYVRCSPQKGIYFSPNMSLRDKLGFRDAGFSTYTVNPAQMRLTKPGERITRDELKTRLKCFQDSWGPVHLAQLTTTPSINTPHPHQKQLKIPTSKSDVNYVNVKRQDADFYTHQTHFSKKEISTLKNLEKSSTPYAPRKFITASSTQIPLKSNSQFNATCMIHGKPYPASSHEGADHVFENDARFIIDNITVCDNATYISMHEYDCPLTRPQVTRL